MVSKRPVKCHWKQVLLRRSANRLDKPEPWNQVTLVSKSQPNVNYETILNIVSEANEYFIIMTKLNQFVRRRRKFCRTNILFTVVMLVLVMMCHEAFCNNVSVEIFTNWNGINCQICLIYYCTPSRNCQIKPNDKSAFECHFVVSSWGCVLVVPVETVLTWIHTYDILRVVDSKLNLKVLYF